MQIHCWIFAACLFFLLLQTAFAKRRRLGPRPATDGQRSGTINGSQKGKCAIDCTNEVDCRCPLGTACVDTDDGLRCNVNEEVICPGCGDHTHLVCNDDIYRPMCKIRKDVSVTCLEDNECPSAYVCDTAGTTSRCKVNDECKPTRPTTSPTSPSAADGVSNAERLSGPMRPSGRRGGGLGLGIFSGTSGRSQRTGRRGGNGRS